MAGSGFILVGPASDRLVNHPPSTLAIAMGDCPGYSIVNKFGENSDVDGSEDIWHGSTTYSGFPTGSAETIELFSANINDANGNTGAWTVTVYGLDENYLEQSTTVTLNGTTAVPVPTLLWTRINRAVVRTAGSSGFNEGIITIRHTTTTANIFAKMPAGECQTHIAAYTIPANKNGYMIRVWAYCSRESGGIVDREATMAIQVRPFGEVFQDKFHINISNSAPLDHDIPGAIYCPPKSDIKWHIEAVTAANTQVSAGFDIILRDI